MTPTAEESIRRPPKWTDVAIVGSYLLGAFWLTSPLWIHRTGMGGAAGSRGGMVFASQDEVVFEFVLAHAAQAVAHLHNPFFTSEINVPDGVNLMANTSVLGIGIPLAPVTLLFGPRVTFLLCTTLAFAGTATSWYFFLARTVVSSRFAAFVGGAFCGFAPGLVSQGSGHLNVVSQFAVPPILWAVIRLGRSGRIARGGILLGLLATYEFFVSEELLLILGLATGVFGVTYALVDRAQARERARGFLAGLGVAVLTAGVLLAYPLWFQFAGPGHYRRLPYDASAYFMDLGSYTTYARRSLAGSDRVTGYLSPNPTEENSFFGLALLVLVTVIVIWLWRSAMVKALAVTAVVFGLLSLGQTIQINGRLTGIPGPMRLVEKLPLLDMIVPARFALIVAPVIGVLLALSLDRVFAAQPAESGSDIPRSTGPVSAAAVRLLWIGAVAAVLLPVVPKPLLVVAGPPVPAFITDGTWERYVPAGRTVVAVPPVEGLLLTTGMLWSARTGLRIHVPGGYFIGPTSPTDDTGYYGSDQRRLGGILAEVSHGGPPPPITAADRAMVLADLKYWRAAVVVLADVPHRDALRETLDALLGPAQWIGEAWVWDVRGVVT